MRIISYSMIYALVLQLLSCASTQRAPGIVQQNLEEDRFIPEVAFKGRDVLNDYTHKPEKTNDQMLDFEIVLEKDTVYHEGDNVHAQIIVNTPQPHLSQTHLHFLFDIKASETSRETVDSILTHTQSSMPNLPSGSTFSADWTSRAWDLNQYDFPKMVASTNLDILELFRQTTRHSFSNGKHRVILILDNSIASSRSTRQSVRDMISILQAKSVSVSIVFHGKKPPVAYFESLIKEGNGVLTFATKNFSESKWWDTELSTTHAKKINAIQVTVQMADKVRWFAKSPSDMEVNHNTVHYPIPELIQGNQHVLLAKLQTPARTTMLPFEMLTVQIRFLNPESNQYQSIKKSKTVQVVSNLNESLVPSHPTIMRSLLILDTYATLQSIIPFIQKDRLFKAIALLTRQTSAIKSQSGFKHDEELQRDAKLMDLYIDRLYERDNKWLSSVENWIDLTWDKNRFESELTN